MKKFLAVVMSTVMVLGIVGCGSSASTEKEPAEVPEAEVLRMGCSADFPPFEYYADDATTIIK